MASILFAQLAVSAHACPMLAAPTQASAMSTTHAPDCSERNTSDTTLPNVCFKHCHDDAQSVDKGTSLTFEPLPLLLAIVSPRMIVQVSQPHAQPALLARATAPPPTIRFCVLRI